MKIVIEEIEVINIDLTMKDSPDPIFECSGVNVHYTAYLGGKNQLKGKVRVNDESIKEMLKGVEEQIKEMIKTLVI